MKIFLTPRSRSCQTFSSFLFCPRKNPSLQFTVFLPFVPPPLILLFLRRKRKTKIPSPFIWGAVGYFSTGAQENRGEPGTPLGNLTGSNCRGHFGAKKKKSFSPRVRREGGCFRLYAGSRREFPFFWGDLGSETYVPIPAFIDLESRMLAIPISRISPRFFLHS